MKTREAFEKWYDSLVMVGSTETVAEWAWQACKAECEKEIEHWKALANRPVTDNTQLIANMESQIAELKAELKSMDTRATGYYHDIEKQALTIAELQSHINVLLEALGQLITHTLECEKRLDEFHGLGDNAGSGCSDVICNSKQALSATPAESLQAHDAEVIEKIKTVIANNVVPDVKGNWMRVKPLNYLLEEMKGK